MLPVAGTVYPVARAAKPDSGGAGGLERGASLVESCGHARRAVELDDGEGRGDGRARLDHEGDATAATTTSDVEQAVQRLAVDEHDAVEIDDELLGVGNGCELLPAGRSRS